MQTHWQFCWRSISFGRGSWFPDTFCVSRTQFDGFSTFVRAWFGCSEQQRLCDLTSKCRHTGKLDQANGRECRPQSRRSIFQGLDELSHHFSLGCGDCKGLSFLDDLGLHQRIWAQGVDSPGYLSIITTEDFLEVLFFEFLKKG